MNIYRQIIVAVCIFIGAIAIQPAARAQAPAATPEDLRAQLKLLVGSTDLDGGVLGAFVQDFKTGDVLFAHNETKPLKPASCNKLHTAAAALHYLGPDYRFQTHVFATGPIDNGTLRGDLVIRGSGDPTISARFERDKDDLTAIFRRWAAELKKAGVRKIDGKIIGDDNYFDDDYFGIGWYPKERAEWYCAEISALSFNDNCVDLVFRGGSESGAGTDVQVYPATNYVTIRNNVRTRRRRSGENVYFFRDDKQNTITARGSVKPESQKKEWAAVYNPTAFFVSVLRDTLEAEGIRVAGDAVDIDDAKGFAAASYRDTATTMTTFTSPPMSRIMKVINNNSQNFYAESVLKTMGVLEKDEGSFAAGCAIVTDFLEAEGLRMDGFEMIDGSGLSWHNRVPAEQLVRIVNWMRSKPEWSELFLDSLPQGGKRGTLSGRFTYSTEAKKAGPRIFGKTGYIGGVRSIAGVMFNAAGREIHFALIVNDFGISDSKAIRFIDDIALACARSTFK